MNLEIVKEKMLKSSGLDKKIIERECSFALQAINASKQLMAATTQSKQAAILNIAQTGLTLNPVMKLAYLVPRWSKDGTICCLEPSYQGLVKLLTDTGSVKAINVQLVYKEDEFTIESSDFDNPITHKPKPFGGRGDIIGVYAIAMLPNGAKQTETMSIEQLYEIRELSESYKAFKLNKIKSCVWTSHEGEMMRKTVLRRIVKYLPKTDTYESVAKAIELDEQDYKVSESKKTYAYGLLENSTMVERIEIANTESTIDSGSNDEVNELIEKLKDIQRDTGRYGMAEINKKVESIAKN